MRSQWKQFIVYIIYYTCSTFLKLKMSFNMGKIHWQFVTPNRRAIEKPKKVLTLNLCHLLILFFRGEYKRWCHFFVHRTKTSLELSPKPHRCHCKNEHKTFLLRNIRVNIIWMSVYISIHLLYCFCVESNDYLSIAENRYSSIISSQLADCT